MASPFVSSLRTSLGATSSSATVSPAPGSTASKSAMASLFSSLDLALDASGAVVSNRSAAKDLLASKSAEKQAEQQHAAAHALKKQQQQQLKQQKEEPVTVLSQALGFFDQEMEQRESFVSRNTKRRQKGRKERGTANPVRGRRQRQDKYKRV